MTTIPIELWYVVIFTSLGLSLGIVYKIAEPDTPWGHQLRTRFVTGIPWATTLTIILVAFFYLFVQDGFTDPNNPIQIPFRAWSYWYPVGMFTSGIAHASLNHITGNLLATLVFGSVAEYAWSHYPHQRGTATFSSFSTNPYIRIFAFVTAAVGVSIGTSLFGLGPVIGFSGVVFAFVGFAIVQKPILTMIAILSTSVVSLFYHTIRSPEVTVTVGETVVGTPWWAGIALQGHALGLLIGIVFGLVIIYHRNDQPNIEYVWVAVLVFAVDRGLWAIYLIEGSGQYRLLRGLGVAAILLLTAVVAVSASASTKTLIDRISLTRREAAFGLVLCVLLALAIVAIPFNLFIVDDPHAGIEDANPVHVADYTVFYTDNVPNQYIPLLPLPGLDTDTDRINASGIIIVSQERNIWWEEISQTELRVNPDQSIRVGGLTWDDEIQIWRHGWSVTGGNQTYIVRASVENTQTLLFESDPAKANVQINERKVLVGPSEGEFEIHVQMHNETIDRAQIPANGEQIEVGGIVFERNESEIIARANGTKLPIAEQTGRE